MKRKRYDKFEDKQNREAKQYKRADGRLVHRWRVGMTPGRGCLYTGVSGWGAYWSTIENNAWLDHEEEMVDWFRVIDKQGGSYTKELHKVLARKRLWYNWSKWNSHEEWQRENQWRIR